MKRATKIITALFILFFGFSLSSSAQVYVRVCPPPPVVVRPPSPHPGHVWVDGEWFYNGRSYQWRDGYWMAPRPHQQWVPGQWKMTRRGYRWIPGHWRKY